MLEGRSIVGPFQMNGGLETVAFYAESITTPENLLIVSL